MHKQKRDTKVMEMLDYCIIFPSMSKSTIMHLYQNIINHQHHVFPLGSLVYISSIQSIIQLCNGWKLTSQVDQSISQQTNN